MLSDVRDMLIPSLCENTGGWRAWYRLGPHQITGISNKKNAESLSALALAEHLRETVPDHPETRAFLSPSSRSLN